MLVKVVAEVSEDLCRRHAHSRTKKIPFGPSYTRTTVASFRRAVSGSFVDTEGDFPARLEKRSILALQMLHGTHGMCLEASTAKYDDPLPERSVSHLSAAR